MSNLGVDMVTADTIEDLYTNFRILVNGFCTLNPNEELKEEV